MQDFRKLDVWGKSHAVVLQVYEFTAVFPPEERYGLTQQMRRAAASIPTNIAEGCGRDANPDFGRFLKIASGSASELQYQLLLARDLGYLEEGRHAVIAQELGSVRKMLTTLIRKVAD